MRTRKSVTAAAERFAQRLIPGFSENHKSQFSKKDNAAWSLIEAAFLLYQREWDQFDISGWNWPHDELGRDGAFSGSEPWTVLLREAVSMFRVHA